MLHPLALLLALSAAPAPCPAGTTLVMSCPVKKKVVAVCIDASPQPKFAQYRFGAAGKITTQPELVVPADTKDGFSPFRFERRTASGEWAVLTFNNGATSYEVYTGHSNGQADAGINVTQGDKRIATLTCSGDFVDNWELLEPYVGSSPSSSLSKAATSGGPVPNPTAGKSMKEICEDDVLLLTKFAWDELQLKNGFVKHCCVKSALGSDDGRCELDWPTSDMPECGYFDELRNTIFARYGYVFKDAKWQQHFAAVDWYAPRSDFNTAWLPQVAADNAAKLKTFGCARP